MIKRLLIFTICCMFSFSVFAADNKDDNNSENEINMFKSSFSNSAAKMNITESGVYLSDFNTAELQKTFNFLQYDEYINPAGNEYPRIFVKNIPSDFAAMQDATVRNRVFIQILTPLALKINQELSEEREDLFALKEAFEADHDFQKPDKYYLEQMAKKYDVSTPFKDTRRYTLILNELIRRVDVVPPSILVGVAAIATDWGTSRIAVLGNNLYKARDWYTNKGLIPVGEDDLSYRYVIYPSIESSMRDFALKANSNINFEQFWNSRAESRRRGSVIYGKRMDWTFMLNSNLHNYAGLLDYLITYYRFFYLDEATLENEYEFEN